MGDHRRARRTPLTTSAPPSVASPAPPEPSARRRLRDVVTLLFPVAPRVQVTRRTVLLASLAVVVAVVVMLLRTPGTGALQSIWEEDARDALTDAYYLDIFRGMVKPVAGYLVVVSRLLGAFAALFPVSTAAAVLSISSALVNALLALLVYVASGAHVQHRLARVLIAAPMLVAPVAENYLSEIYNRPVCIHFFMMYALFWTILWVPQSTAGKSVAIVTVGLSAFSSILAVGYIPLALLRVLVRRDRTGFAMLALLGAGAAANLFLRLSGSAPRGVESSLDVLWAVERYVTFGVPQSILGFRFGPADGALGIVAIAVPWLLIGAAVAVAVRRRVTTPTWLLAATAGSYSLWLFAMMVMAQGAVTQRYMLPIELLIFAALAVLLVPSPAWSGRRFANAPLIALAVLIAVISAFNYRWSDTYRSHAPVWRDQVRQAAALCAADQSLERVYVRSAPEPYWSYVLVPCSRLATGPYYCGPPECVWLEGPNGREPS